MTAQLRTGLAAVVATLLDGLHSAGIQASMVAADLQAPGILVGSPVLEFRFGRCYSAEFTCWAIAPGLARDQALAQLSDLLEAANAALVDLGTTFPDASPDDLGPPTGGLLPAYQFTFVIRIRGN